MKKVLALVLAIIGLTFISCEETIEEPDPADKFVGIYDLTITEISYFAGQSISTVDSGKISITKTGTNSIAMNGSFNTTGIVSGDIIQLGNEYIQEGSYWVLTSFSSAILAGKMLYINATGIGVMTYMGYTGSFQNVLMIEGQKITN